MVGQKRRGRGRNKEQAVVLSKDRDFEGFDTPDNDSSEPTSLLQCPSRLARLQCHLVANSSNKFGKDFGNELDQSAVKNSISSEEVPKRSRLSEWLEFDSAQPATPIIEDEESAVKNIKMVDAAVDNQDLSSGKTNAMSEKLTISTSLPLTSESPAVPLKLCVAPEELEELDIAGHTAASMAEHFTVDATSDINTNCDISEHQPKKKTILMVSSTSHEYEESSSVQEVTNELCNAIASIESSVGKVANELSKGTIGTENSSVGKLLVSNELPNDTSGIEMCSVGKEGFSNKASIDTKSHAVIQSMSVGQDQPIKIKQKAPGQPGAARDAQKGKKVTKKFGEEFILVTVAKNVPPSQGQHECVLCLPGKHFLPKELLFHMRTLQHLKHMLELLDFESFMKLKQSNNANVFVDRLTQMLGADKTPKKVHAVRPEASEEMRCKLKVAIQELREQSRKVWREKQSKLTNISTASPVEVSAKLQSAQPDSAEASVEGSLKNPLAAKTNDCLSPAQHPDLEQATVESVTTLTSTNIVLQKVQSNSGLTTSDKHVVEASTESAVKSDQNTSTTNQQEGVQTTHIDKSESSIKPVQSTKLVGRSPSAQYVSSVCRTTDSTAPRSPASLPLCNKANSSQVAKTLNSQTVSQPRSEAQRKEAANAGRDVSKTRHDQKLISKEALLIKTEKVDKESKKIEEEPEVLVVEKPPKEFTLIVLDANEEAAGQRGPSNDSPNSSFSEFVAPLPPQSSSIKKDFDHVVIMGDCKQLKSSRQWNYKRTTFIDEANATLGSSLPRLNVLKSSLPKKTLWLFLADMEMVCTQVDAKDSLCNKAYCSLMSTAPLPDYRFMSQASSSTPSAELDSRIIHNLVHLRMKAFKYALVSFRSSLPSPACVVLLPLMPRKVHCALRDYNHTALHELFNNQPDILFTSGHAGNFRRAVRQLDLDWRVLAGDFYVPHRLKTHVLAFTNIPSDPCRVSINIYNAEKAYTHVYKWYTMVWNVVDTALGVMTSLPKEIQQTANNRISMKQSLNSPIACTPNMQASFISRGVSSPRLIMVPPVLAFNGVGGIEPTRPKAAPRVPATPVVSASVLPAKPTFPSAEVMIHLPPPTSSRGPGDETLDNLKRSSASSRKSSTDKRPSVITLSPPRVSKKAALLPVTAFPCLDISNGYPVYTSNIAKDVSVMLMKKVFQAIGDFTDYRLETNQEDNSTCLSTTVYTNKECASAAVRVLGKLTLNQHQLRVFSSHVNPPADEWDTNELVIKHRVDRILTNANKTVDWVSVESPTDQQDSRGAKGKSKSPRNSKSPARRRIQSPVKKTISSGMKSKSPIKKRCRSPVHRKTRSPSCRRTRSPSCRKTRSPVRKRSRSPIRRRTRSPIRRITRSPVRKRSRSPIRRKNRSPVQRRTKSPITQRSRSPARKRTRSPSTRSKHRSVEGRTSRSSSGLSNSQCWNSAVSVVAKGVTASLSAPAVGAGDPNTVILSSEGTSLTRLFVMELHQLFNGLLAPVIKPRVGWLLKLSDPRQAQLLTQVMNNLRLVNTVVTARQDGTPEGREIRVPDGEVEKHRSRIHKCCKDYDNRALVLIQEQVAQALDVYTFKIEPCATQNCPRMRCIGYHDNTERRRNILQRFYRVEMCPTEVSGRPCPEHEFCQYSHTANEALLHPALFLRDTCTRLTLDGRCSNVDFCIDAHPGSPDMFYHESWEDLYLTGLENSFFFLIGAVRNLFKAKNSVFGKQTGFGHNTRVMFITPSPDIARYAHDLVIYVAKKHEITVAPLNTLMGEIAIGSLSAMFSHVMSISHRGFDRMSALVLDDISGLLGPTLCRNFTSLMLKTFKERKTDSVNRVAVCSEVRDYEVARAKKMLNTTFKVISKEDLVKLVPVNHPTEVDVAHNNSRWDPPVVAPRIRQGASRPTVDANRQSAIVDVNHQTSYPNIARHYSTFPEAPFSGQRAAPFEDQRVPINSGVRPPGAGHLRDPLDSRDAWPSAGPSRHPPSSSLLTPTQAAAAADSPARQYISEKEKLMQELQEKYRIYTESPARHPRCREFFDTFAALPNKGQLDWKALWMNELEVMKSDEYQDRMKQLVNKYKELANNSVKPAGVSQPFSSYNHHNSHYDRGDQPQPDSGSTWRTGAAAQPSVWKAGSSDTSTWRAGNSSDQQETKASSWRFDAAQDRAQGEVGSWSTDANITEMSLRRSLDAIAASSRSHQRMQDVTAWGAGNRSSSLDGEPLQSELDERRFPNCGRDSFTRLTTPSPPVISSNLLVTKLSNNNTSSATCSFKSSCTEYNPASPLHSPPPPPGLPFDLEEMFGLLERLAPSLGLLTPVVTSLAAVARQRRATSANDLDIFEDKVIGNVMALALNKFKDEMKTASADRYLMLQRAVGLGEQIMEYSSNPNFTRA